MPFHQRVRLPIHPYTPQFPTEANRFRLANGVTKTQSVTIRKTYTLKTDSMSEGFHQKLVIALNHDNVTIESDKYLGGVAMDGEYAINWPDFLDYPLAPGEAVIQVTPFDATNTNCATCDVLTQLTLVDDDAGEFAEGEAKQVDTFANDTICCFPPDATIVFINTGYMDTVTIDTATGIATLTAKNPAPTVGSIVMATYRVTCPDGTYDEADIYGSVAGSEPACEQPSGIDIGYSITGPPFVVTMSISNPAVTPVGGFEWILYDSSAPGVPIDSGTEMDNIIEFSVPNADHDYIFSVRSACGEGVFSPYTNQEFTTPEGSGEASNCGTFAVACDDETLSTTIYYYSYMDCAGVIQNSGITNLAVQFVCMLMDTFNQPVYFQDHSGFINATYDSLC